MCLGLYRNPSLTVACLTLHALLQAGLLSLDLSAAATSLGKHTAVSPEERCWHLSTRLPAFMALALGVVPPGAGEQEAPKAKAGEVRSGEEAQTQAELRGGWGPKHFVSKALALGGSPPHAATGGVQRHKKEGADMSSKRALSHMPEHLLASSHMQHLPQQTVSLAPCFCTNEPCVSSAKKAACHRGGRRGEGGNG